MEKNWTKIRKLAGECAGENMSRGMNCSESVFAALIQSGALDQPPETVAYATGFGSGGGGAGLTCGALASAILANNMVHGRSHSPQGTSRAALREGHYQRYNHIVRDFVKMSGSGLCRDIINQFEEGYQDEAARPNCIRICRGAAKIAVDYLKMSAEEAAALGYDFSIVGIRNWL